MKIEKGLAPVAGSKMRYVAFGRGEKPLVLIPGLLDGLSAVDTKARPLAREHAALARDYKVYIFSRRDGLPRGFTIRDMAADQAEAMRALGLCPAAVIGVSQGGMIAQFLAAGHPELVEKLVLAVTAPYTNDLIRAGVKARAEYAERRDLRAILTDSAEKAYSEKRLKRLRPFFPLLSLVPGPRDFGRFLANTDAILGFDARGVLGDITCPTLIIGGGRDATVGAEGSYELHEGIPGSELFVYPELGHAAFQEAPDFAERVLAFLEKA